MYAIPSLLQLSPGSKRILKEKQKAQSLGQSPKPTDLMTAMYNHCTQYPISMLCGSSPTAAAVAASSSPAGSSSAGSPYLDRVQQQMQGGPQGSPAGNAAQQQQQQAPEWCRHSFKPAITRKAAAMKPRSFEEMSEGDRLRREAKVVRACITLLLVLRQPTVLCWLPSRPETAMSCTTE